MPSPKIHVGKRGGRYYMSGTKKVYIKTKSPKTRKSPKSPKSRGCKRQFTKKYETRNSPAFPANECCGMVKSRYGVSWVSTPDKNGICRWQKA